MKESLSAMEGRSFGWQSMTRMERGVMPSSAKLAKQQGAALVELHHKILLRRQLLSKQPYQPPHHRHDPESGLPASTIVCRHGRTG